ncbi:hypothetical protein GCM10020001_059080 [Nonomuraea salmonea]
MVAGTAANAIPDDGVAEGTVRCLDEDAWHAAPDLIKSLLESVAGAYGVEATLDYTRGVPPVVNDELSVEMLSAAAEQALGAGAVVPTQQSLGGARTSAGTSSRSRAPSPGSARGRLTG